jgi:hypothetical protein
MTRTSNVIEEIGFFADLLDDHDGCVGRNKMGDNDSPSWRKFNPSLAEFCRGLLSELHDHELRNMRLRS